jgi:hypothetical protein
MVMFNFNKFEKADKKVDVEKGALKSKVQLTLFHSYTKFMMCINKMVNAEIKFIVRLLF